MGTADSDRKSSWQSYRRYVFILLLLAAVRVFEVATSGSMWRAMAYDRRAAWIAASILAAIVCCVTTSFARRYYPTAITILLSVLAGAATTLIVSTFPGMIIGLVAGFIFAFDVTRRFSIRAAKFASLVGLPALFAGLAVGFFGAATSVVRVEQPQQQVRTAVLIILFLLGIGMTWTFFLARFKQRGSSVAMALTLAAFWLAAIVSVPLGVQFDTQRRLAVMSQSQAMSRSGALVPLGYQSFSCGIWEPTELWLFSGISLRNGRLGRPFRNISWIWLGVSDGEVDTEGLTQLDLRSVQRLDGRWRKVWLDDRALLAFRDSQLMRELSIHGAQITDEGLRAFEHMNLLTTLDLSDTDIDGSGLRHLHPNVALSSVSLRDTRVDDAALEHLASSPLSFLDLSGTAVTGSGLKALDTRFLQLLNLSRSQFREEHLDLVPTVLRQLDLDGTRLSVSGVKKLVRRITAGVGQLQRLSLINSGIRDDAVRELASINIHELHIDATLLTGESCLTLARSQKVELHYEASVIPFDVILHKYAELKSELERLQGPAPMHMSGLDRVAIVIHDLPLEKEMVASLKELDTCLLLDATVDGQPVGNGHRNRMDVSDLILHFQSELTVLE